MIESTDNGVQLAVFCVCSFVALRRYTTTQHKEWLLVTLTCTCLALGDLYWQLYLMLLHTTPQYFYVSDLSWDTAFLFLHLLLMIVSTESERGYRHPSLWIPVAFAAAMCLFYMQWGDYLNNVYLAAITAQIMRHAMRGLLYLRANPQADARRRMLYILALTFCLAEYGTWTSSCFWSGDILVNPYFWFDSMVTVAGAFLLPATARLAQSSSLTPHNTTAGQ